MHNESLEMLSFRAKNILHRLLEENWELKELLGLQCGDWVFERQVFTISNGDHKDPCSQWTTFSAIDNNSNRKESAYGHLPTTL